MPLYYPDILQNNNSNYPLTDITEVRGNTYPITNLADTGSIPEAKRKIGNLIFVSSTQKFYGYYGSTTGSSDWDNTSNWKELTQSNVTGNFITTGSAGVNQYLSGSLTVQQGITGSIQTASFTPNAFTSASFNNGQLTLFTGNLNSNSISINSGSFSGSFTGSFLGNLTGTASFAQVALTASFFSGSISNAVTALTSSFPFTVTGSSIRSYNTTIIGTQTSDNLYIGRDAGLLSTNSNQTQSIMIGTQAGEFAESAFDVVFIGTNAGNTAINSRRTILLGANAGATSNDVTESIFIGTDSGYGVSAVQKSIFIGSGSGWEASSANNSVFIGAKAGEHSYNSAYSVYIGFSAGDNVNPLGNGPGQNNIIIGTNVSLEENRQNSINIAGIIFGTGSYFSTTEISSGSSGGRIGINVPNPQYNLDVSGSVRFGNITNQVSQNLLAYDTSSGVLYYVPTSSIVAAPTFPYTGSAIISGSLTITGSLNVLGTGSFSSLIYQNVQVVNAVSTGSNTLGDSNDDIQQLIGSVIVTGSVSITNTTTGSVFVVNNPSSSSILQVFSDNTVLIGESPNQALYTTKKITANSGSAIIYSIPTASYTAIFADYTIASGSNLRAGQIMTLWSGSKTQLSDVSTISFGSTSNFEFISGISGSNLALAYNTTTDTWEVKTIIRGI